MEFWGFESRQEMVGEGVALNEASTPKLRSEVFKGILDEKKADEKKAQEIDAKKDTAKDTKVKDAHSAVVEWERMYAETLKDEAKEIKEKQEADEKKAEKKEAKAEKQRAAEREDRKDAREENRAAREGERTSVSMMLNIASGMGGGYAPYGSVGGFGMGYGGFGGVGSGGGYCGSGGGFGGGIGFGGGGYGGGGFSIGFAVGGGSGLDLSNTGFSIGFGAVDARAKSRALDALINQLLCAIAQGNVDAITSAITVCNLKAKTTLIGAALNTIKAMQNYDKQMKKVSEDIGDLAGQQGQGKDVSARLAQKNAEINQISMFRQAIANNLRDIMTMVEEMSTLENSIYSRKDREAQFYRWA